jgi:hypothetical protein
VPKRSNDSRRSIPLSANTEASVILVRIRRSTRRCLLSAKRAAERSVTSP